MFNPPSHLVDPHQPTTPPSLGDPTIEPAHLLNADISADEVLAALRQRKNGKPPGMDGLPAEMLKYACPRQGCTPILGMNPLD